MGTSLCAAVIGASGYGGAELVRLILAHPKLELGSLCAHSRAGDAVEDVLPSFRGILSGTMQPIEPETLEADIAFLGLPHGASAKVASVLRARGVRVVDLSADFRLEDRAVFEHWYGEHGASEHFGTATYGLVEYGREALRGSEFIAVPGCYPTAAILTLAPLVEAGLVELEGIIVDAKSGVSGAGRKHSPASHLPHAAEGVRAYKAGGTHRHTPEIEQFLSGLAEQPVRLTFTPHLVPMSRGILATAYARAKEGVSEAQLHGAAESRYADSPLVAVTKGLPDTLFVRGSARAHVSYRLDERTRQVVAFGAIDNLLKGTSGQAIQALNVSMGWEETLGLESPGAWP